MGRGGDDFHSPEMQLAPIRRAMVTENLTEIDIIDDDIDQTGRTFDRKGIARIRQLVEGGHIDAIVFYDIKRFGRNVLEGLMFARWLDERGVRLISASENIDTSTPMGRFIFTQLLAMGELQSDEIGRYWAGVHRRRKLAGLVPRAPRGYHRVDRRDVPHPTLGRVYEQAFRMYAKGDRMRDITDMIYRQAGIRVRAYHFKRSLRNPFYRGLIEIDGELIAGQHQPLVDEQTWQRVERRLTRETKEAPRTKEMSWALSGLLVCEIDDHPVHAHRYAPRGEPGYNVTLICSRQADLGKEQGCAGIGQPHSAAVIRAILDVVETYMRDLLLNTAKQSEVLVRHAEANSSAATLRAQLTRIRGAMTRLTTSFALEDTPEAVYRASIIELKEAEKATAQALREVETESITRSPLETASLARALLDDWPDMTEAERNRALRGVIKRVVIRASDSYREPVIDRITVEWL